MSHYLLIGKSAAGMGCAAPGKGHAVAEQECTLHGSRVLAGLVEVTAREG